MSGPSPLNDIRLLTSMTTLPRARAADLAGDVREAIEREGQDDDLGVAAAAAFDVGDVGPRLAGDAAGVLRIARGDRERCGRRRRTTVARAWPTLPAR